MLDMLKLLLFHAGPRVDVFQSENVDVVALQMFVLEKLAEGKRADRQGKDDRHQRNTILLSHRTSSTEETSYLICSSCLPQTHLR